MPEITTTIAFRGLTDMPKTTGGLLSIVLIAAWALAEDAPKPAEPGTLLLIDGGGKEQKIKAWKYTAGTRRLSWLAPAEKGDAKTEKEKPADKDKPAGKDRLTVKPAGRPAAVGPEALVVRDANAGQPGDLVTPQTRHPPPPVRR